MNNINIYIFPQFQKVISLNKISKVGTISLCNLYSTRRWRYVKRPDKPQILPPAGSAISLAAEIINKNNGIKLDTNLELENKIDDIKVLSRTIESLPTLIETSNTIEDDSSTSKLFPAGIPKGF